MNYLTPQQVLFLHSRLINEIGGSHGVRDIGLLESAVNRPKATYGGVDLYPDVCSKAAALMLSIIQIIRSLTVTNGRPLPRPPCSC
jgi:death-on-curing protein